MYICAVAAAACTAVAAAACAAVAAAACAAVAAAACTAVAATACTAVAAAACTAVAAAACTAVAAAACAASSTLWETWQGAAAHREWPRLVEPPEPCRLVQHCWDSFLVQKSNPVSHSKTMAKILPGTIPPKILFYPPTQVEGSRSLLVTEGN